MNGGGGASGVSLRGDLNCGDLNVRSLESRLEPEFLQVRLEKVLVRKSGDDSSDRSVLIDAVIVRPLLYGRRNGNHTLSRTSSVGC